MSEENVETVRRHTEGWNRRDLKTWLASFHPDAEIDWSRSRGPLKGVFTAGVRSSGMSSGRPLRTSNLRCTAAGSEVVVPNTAHMRGRQGIEVVARSTLVFTLEKGRITRLRLFQWRAEGLEAAGLSE
jgi:ketosteroid isomerase-like protein